MRSKDVANSERVFILRRLTEEYPETFDPNGTLL